MTRRFSKPSIPRFPKGSLAQSVEQLTFNQLVRGSSPRRPTIFKPLQHCAERLFLGLYAGLYSHLYSHFIQEIPPFFTPSRIGLFRKRDVSKKLFRMLFVEVDQCLRGVFVDVMILGRRRVLVPHSLARGFQPNGQVRGRRIEFS